jgi:hypothetical protein
MRKESYIRLCWCFGLVVLGVPLLIRSIVLLRASPVGLNELIEFIFDDGYYYLGIAANFADTGRSTLDGSTFTNGYQPLWLLCLTGLAKCVGTDPWRFFVASCVFIYLLALSAPLLALCRWRSSWRSPALCLAVGLSIILIQQPDVFLQGLEPILFAPLMLPLILLIERGSSRRDWVWLSVALALAFLIRLDALTLYLSSIAVLAWATTAPGHRSSPKFIIAAARRIVLPLSIAVIPTVIAYLVVNKWFFDSAVPISGIAKMIGGPKFSNWGVAWMYFGRWRSLCLLLAILLPLEGIARRLAHPEPLYYRSLAVLLMSLVMQCVYYCALSTWNIWPWYSYMLGIAMAVIIARIVYLGSLLLEFRYARFAALAATVLIGAWAWNRGMAFVAGSLPAEARSSAPWLGRIMRGDKEAGNKVTFNQVSLSMLKDFFPSAGITMVAMGDRAGGLAYWGRRQVSVVQTEGLTLDNAYLRARAANEGLQYLQTHYPIAYLIIDREVVPQVIGQDGRSEYVVAEPIQGRVTFSAASAFCFPEDAVRYKQTYDTTWRANVRITFDLALRATCSPAATELVSSLEHGMGLRQYSLPSEYDPSVGGPMNKGREDRDRDRARARLKE